MPSPSSSSLSMPSSDSGSPSSSKSDKPSLIVTIKLPPHTLRKFSWTPFALTPSKAESIVDEESKTALSAMSPTTAVSPAPTPSVASPAPTGPGSPNNLEMKAVNGLVEAVKKGSKRGAGGGARPGPRPKKPRLDDGTSFAPSRLGPKASLGAINAGLRALDRTGNPCKKWTKTPIALKSFTGFRFALKVYETHLQNNMDGKSGEATSDSVSVASGNSGDAATPKDFPMEDVQSTDGKVNGDEKVNGINGINGVHVSTPDSILVEAGV